MTIVRRELPKKLPRRRAGQALAREVIASIRSGELTIAQGARQLGTDSRGLYKRVWREAKDDAFARDVSCIVCSRVGQLDAQHRRARKAGGTADPLIAFGLANLVALCRSDHDWVEQHPDRARELGLRLDDGEAPAETPVRRHGVWVLLADDGSVTSINKGE